MDGYGWCSGLFEMIIPGDSVFNDVSGGLKAPSSIWVGDIPRLSKTWMKGNLQEPKLQGKTMVGMSEKTNPMSKKKIKHFEYTNI